MKYFIILVIVLIVNPLKAQTNFLELTGFSFKSSRKHVEQKAKSMGGWVPESIREEKSLGVNGLNLFGISNDQVIFQFYQDQMYSMSIFLDPQTDEETTDMFNRVYQKITNVFGEPVGRVNNTTMWLANRDDPDSDKLSIKVTSNNKLMVLLMDGELLNLAEPQHKRNALQKIMQQSL